MSPSIGVSLVDFNTLLAGTMTLFFVLTRGCLLMVVLLLTKTTTLTYLLPSFNLLI